MAAAILCFAGLTFEVGHPAHLSARSTKEPGHFYDDIAAELGDARAPLR